jgi:hypothetical protein
LLNPSARPGSGYQWRVHCTCWPITTTSHGRIFNPPTWRTGFYTPSNKQVSKIVFCHLFKALEWNHLTCRSSASASIHLNRKKSDLRKKSFLAEPSWISQTTVLVQHLEGNPDPPVVLSVLTLYNFSSKSLRFHPRWKKMSSDKMRRFSKNNL